MSIDELLKDDPLLRRDLALMALRQAEELLKEAQETYRKADLAWIRYVNGN